jgi:hypothetical protein
VLTAAAGVTGPDVSNLANYGALGTVTALLLFFGFRAYMLEVKRNGQLQDDLRDKNQAIQDKVIPALTMSGVAVKEAADLMRELMEERERDLRRQLDGRR